MARDIIEKCPHCGTKVRGELEQTFSRKVTRGAVKKGSVTAASTVAGAAIGSVVPIAGTAVGAAIGFATGVVAGAVMDDHVSKVSDDIEDVFFDNATFNFCCPDCGHSWKSEYSNNNKDCEYRPVNQDDDDNEGLVPLTSSTVQKIKQIISDNTSINIEDIVSTDNLEDDLAADDEEKQNIIDELESEFDISITKDVDDFTFVDDFIECVTGESIWEEDDQYDGSEDDDADETTERFSSFFNSYINDEYKDMEMTKLANMFEGEAEECPSEGIKAQYYCLAAVVRTEYFIAEWLDNQFKNYSGEDQYVNLLQKCICDGLDDIEKSLELVPKDKEYLLINGILSMLNDFYVETKNDKETFVDKYVKLLEDCRDCDNCMFNMEWLAELYMKVYNSIIEMFDKGASEEATSTNSEAEQEYINELKDILADGEISTRERRLLDKIRQKLGITEDRAKELEASLSEPQLTEDEQEYLDMYREYAEEEISPRERRLLDKIRLKLGISEERAKEIEKM